MSSKLCNTQTRIEPTHKGLAPKRNESKQVFLCVDCIVVDPRHTILSMWHKCSHGKVRKFATFTLTVIVSDTTKLNFIYRPSVHGSCSVFLHRWHWTVSERYHDHSIVDWAFVLSSFSRSKCFPLPPTYCHIVTNDYFVKDQLVRIRAYMRLDRGHIKPVTSSRPFGS